MPINNIDRDDLQAAMTAALPAEAVESVLRACGCAFFEDGYISCGVKCDDSKDNTLLLVWRKSQAGAGMQMYRELETVLSRL